MEERPVLDYQPRVFSKEEKVAFVFLIIAGIGGLFFGMKYLGKNLEAPFVFSYNGEKFLTSDQKESAEAEAMKGRDTDGDTLNDYDEVYIYKTSAYLADSDSDGYNDNTELESGNDPNCPIGKECTGSASVDTAVDASDALIGGLAEPQAPDLVAAQAILDQAEDPAVAITQVTAEQLRDLLIANGADEATVNQVDDSQLMLMYEEALRQYAESQSSSGTP